MQLTIVTSLKRFEFGMMLSVTFAIMIACIHLYVCGISMCVCVLVNGIQFVAIFTFPIDRIEQNQHPVMFGRGPEKALLEALAPEVSTVVRILTRSNLMTHYFVKG